MTHITTSSSRSPVRVITSTIAGALGAAALVAVLAGCSTIASYMPEQQRHYDRFADAPTSSNSEDAAWFMPGWVPDDASDIDVRLSTSGAGYAIRFASDTGVDTAHCTPLTDAHGGPAMTADFLPEGLPTTGLVDCGDGRATARIGSAWYSWTTVEPIVDGPAPDETPTGSPSADTPVAPVDEAAPVVR